MGIRYFGTGGLYIEWQGHALLMPPFFTNPRIWQVPFGRLGTNDAAVHSGLEDMDLSRVRAIAAGHSHYDHIGDLPVIAEKAPQARIYVNVSGARALAAVPVLAGRVITLESTERRGWIDLKDAAGNKLPIRFLPVRSAHAPHFWGIHLMGGALKSDWMGAWNTHRFWSLKEGQPFAFVIDLLSPDQDTVFRLYYQDSANPPKEGIPRLSDRHQYDLAVLCMASYYFVRKQPETILGHLRPRHVLVTHYEDFFQPADKSSHPADKSKQSVRFVTLLTDSRANRYFQRAQQAMSGWEEETVGPEGTVCGPSSPSWTMPVPGEWMRFRVGG